MRKRKKIKPQTNRRNKAVIPRTGSQDGAYLDTLKQLQEERGD